MLPREIIRNTLNQILTESLEGISCLENVPCGGELSRCDIGLKCSEDTHKCIEIEGLKCKSSDECENGLICDKIHKKCLLNEFKICTHKLNELRPRIISSILTIGTEHEIESIKKELGDYSKSKLSCSPHPICGDGQRQIGGECRRSSILEEAWTDWLIDKSLYTRGAESQWIRTLAHANDPIECIKSTYGWVLDNDMNWIRPPNNFDIRSWYTEFKDSLFYLLESESPNFIKQQQSLFEMLNIIYNKRFYSTLLNTCLIVLVVFVLVILLIYFLAFLRIHYKKTAWIVVVLCSFPAFIVGYFMQHITSFQAVNVDEHVISATIQFIIVCVFAGGVTFDVGRRTILIVDEIMRSPMIIGLKYFGIDYQSKSLINIFHRTSAHIGITIGDVFGFNSKGLSKAENLEHFVMRAVEYRMLEHLASRGTFLIDNLLILGLMFNLPNLATSEFAMMLKTSNPVDFVSVSSIIIFLSVILRVIITMIRLRLFPRRKIS